MEMSKKIIARVDRFSDLPESILIYILSMLLEGKEVVRTSVLSTRWRFLWMSVPVSLEFFTPHFGSEMEILNFITSIQREFYYWRSCKKIRSIFIFGLRDLERYVKDVDLWVHFATKVADVEEFTLGLFPNSTDYEFPQFAFKNTTLRDLTLFHCRLNPSTTVSWSGLVTLSFWYLNLTDGVMEKVLSGCPNLERLELHLVTGIHRLEISSVKLRYLGIEGHRNENRDLWLEILAPNIQTLRLWGKCSATRIRQRNVASLVTAVLYLNFIFDDKEGNLEKQCRYCWKELLHGVAHVKNLELGCSCLEILSMLELKGWQSPPSSRKFLFLRAALVELDLPGICSFLQSSPDLETLVFEWCYINEPRDLLSIYTNKDGQNRRFETSNFDLLLLHLKTIKLINFRQPLSRNKFILSLVKYFLKNATVLEKLVIIARSKGSDVSQDYVKMEQELLSLPRSSPNASVVFSY